MSPKVLFDGKHIQALHFPNASPFTLITFDIMHAKANGKSAFGQTLCHKLNINLIGIVPKYPCWYPGAEMKKLASITRDAVTDGQDVIAYGASMGGYGALRWGQYLGASHVLSCSPQFSIAPADLGEKDKRYEKYFDPENHRGMAISADDFPASTAVLYDPYFKPDGDNAHMIQGLGKGTFIPVFHMLHSVVSCISGSKTALSIFTALREGRMKDIRATVLSRRKESSCYYISLANAALAAQKLDLSLAIIEKIRATDPIGYHLQIGRYWMVQRNPEQAAEHYKQVLEQRADHPIALAKLSQISQQLAS